MSKLKFAFGAVPYCKKAMLKVSSFAILATFLSGEKALAQSSQYNIAPQSVEQALAEFSEIEGLFLLNDVNLDGVRSLGLNGSYTRDEALRLLLLGTGLSYEFGDSGALVILVSGDREGESLSSVSVDNSKDDKRDNDEHLELETLIVTGTNIRGVENPTTPVLRFDREDINLSGAGTLEEFLRTIPQNFGSETLLTDDSANPNTSGNNITQGVAVDLRGLGAGSTLTLINGRRMAFSGFGSFVDVSILPLGVIERVDILTDGASAIYGSDAVGGVVNFVTRKDFEGFDLNTRYATVTEGSMQDFGVGGAGGVAWDSGGAFVGVDYLESDPLLSSERGFVDQDVVQQGGTLGAETEKFSVAGSVNQEIGSRLAATVDLLYSDRNAENTRNFGFASLTSRSKQEALFVNSRLEYTLTEDVIASVFFDYGKNRTKVRESSSDFEDVLTFDNNLYVVEGQLSGKLFELPSGQVSFAVGALHREEEYDQGGAQPIIQGDRDVTAAYGELLIPIIGADNAMPFVKRFELSAAGRYEDYSDFGDTFDPKIGLYWELNDQLSLRGSYSESFRAPDLRSLNQQQTLVASFLFPFFFTAVEPPAQDDRLPNGFILFLSPGGGNPNLIPETARTWSAGFTYEPRFVSGLTLEGNFFDISYENRLDSVNIFEPIQVPEFTELVDIPPNIEEMRAIFNDIETGRIDLNASPLIPFDLQPEDIQVFIRGGLRNIVERDVQGLDINLRYERDTSVGRFSSGLNASYIIDFISRATENSDSVDQINRIYRPVDLQLRGDISWSKSGFTVFAAVNHLNDYRDNNDESIDAFTTVDLSLSYDTGAHFSNIILNDIRLALSIRNVFDEDPPFAQTIDGLNFDTANSNPFGRIISFSLSKRF